jgi:hypothetical protein
MCGTFLGWDVAAPAPAQSRPVRNLAATHTSPPQSHGAPQQYGAPHYGGPQQYGAPPTNGVTPHNGYALPAYSIQPQQPASRPAAPLRRDSPSLRVEITEPALNVEPGQSVATTVTIYNQGHQVEELAIRVAGPAAAFSAVDPPTLKIYPATATTCALRFAPPRTQSCPAGTIGYGVEVSSMLNSSVAAGASGTITVGSFTDLTAELSPESTRSRLRSVHHLTLINNGNSVQRVHLAAADRDSALRFDLPQSAIDVPPGRIAVPVAVRGRAALIGAGTRHAFDVAISNTEGSTLTRTAGTRITPAWLPAWLLAALVVLALLAGGVFTLSRLRPAGNTTAPPPPASAAPQPEAPAEPEAGATNPAEPSLPPPPSLTAQGSAPPNGGADGGGAGGGGAAQPQLSIKTAPLAFDVDVSEEGTADWVHWGHRVSDDTAAAKVLNGPAAQECADAKCANRKRGVQQQISTLEVVGGVAANRLRDPQARKFTWNDGAPVLAAAAQGCITVAGVNNGFSVSVSADKTLRTLRLYVSVKQGRAQFSGRLSDNSAKAVTDNSITVAEKNVSKPFVIEIKYRSKGANQTLMLSYLLQTDAGAGNVTLHGATLQ